jgi:hypothetical protein
MPHRGHGWPLHRISSPALDTPLLPPSHPDNLQTTRPLKQVGCTLVAEDLCGDCFMLGVYNVLCPQTPTMADVRWVVRGKPQRTTQHPRNKPADSDSRERLHDRELSRTKQGALSACYSPMDTQGMQSFLPMLSYLAPDETPLWEQLRLPPGQRVPSDGALLQDERLQDKLHGPRR